MKKMKTVKVVSFMHAVIGQSEHTTIIKAASVNKFCIEMDKQQVGCVLEMRDFRRLVALYPQDMSITPTALTIKPTPRLKKSLYEASRFDVNRPDDKEICRVWKSILK